MKTEADIKDMVRRKYSEIASQSTAFNRSSCCGATESSTEVYNIMSDSYESLDGYSEEADLGLGCGLPTAFAMINKGDTVVDLGSGAGNDCFVARHECGAEGKVIGVDFSEVMVEKARHNADALGFNNVEFRLGDIENMPIGDGRADVVVSNCVLNLLPNKSRIFGEIFRVLKPGGHFSISDVVLKGQLPQALVEDAEMYAGCVSGAIQKSEYLAYIEKAGFIDVRIQKEKAIVLPTDLLSKYQDAEGVAKVLSGEVGILSLTVYAQKPTTAENTVKPRVKLSDIQKCAPNSGCC